MLKAKLLVIGGDAKFGEVDLLLPTTIGRGREATLTLPHPLVSRMHCEIFERDGILVVRDLSSLNGTFVNNQKIVGEEVLEPGQLLTLGNVTFRADYVAGEVVSTSDPSRDSETGEQAQLQRVGDTDMTELESNEKETVYNQNGEAEPLVGVGDCLEDAAVATQSGGSHLDTIQLDVPDAPPSDSVSTEAAPGSLARKLPR